MCKWVKYWNKYLGKFVCLFLIHKNRQYPYNYDNKYQNNKPTVREFKMVHISVFELFVYPTIIIWIILTILSAYMLL